MNMSEQQKRSSLLVSSNGLLQAKDPYVWYREMRTNSPVHYDPDRDCWDIFRYEDVQRVLSDYAVFSSNRDSAEQGGAFQESLISMDPPKHRQYRLLVSQAFTPKAIEALGPRIVSITDELLNKVLQEGTMDIVHDLAYPLPVIVIAELLGVPPHDREKFKEWSDAMVKGVDVSTDQTIQEVMLEYQRVQQELGQYFMQVIEQRRREPKDDLISAFLQADIDGQRLNMIELLGFCMLLLVAGNETTTNLVTNAVLCFTEEPEILEQLKDDPSLLPIAIEEVLRYRSPVQSMSRYTTTDVEMGGHKIKAGQEVIAWMGSANRDEEKFVNAERFVIDRSPNPHMAFGSGVHFCLGASLARLEAKITLQSVLELLPNIQQVTDGELEFIPSPFVYGVKRLPVKFDTPPNH